MIHRPSRDRLALALRRYAAKRITNDQLAEIDVDWRDRGAVAVKEMAWRLYDDMHTHKAVGRHALNSTGRRMVARWVMFLHSDLEYVWPEYNFMRAAPGILSAFTLGWWGRREGRRWREFLDAGDFEVWPFIDKESESGARNRPKFLAATSEA